MAILILIIAVIVLFSFRGKGHKAGMYMCLVIIIACAGYEYVSDANYNKAQAAAATAAAQAVSETNSFPLSEIKAQVGALDIPKIQSGYTAVVASADTYNISITYLLSNTDDEVGSYLAPIIQKIYANNPDINKLHFIIAVPDSSAALRVAYTFDFTRATGSNMAGYDNKTLFDIAQNLVRS